MATGRKAAPLEVRRRRGQRPGQDSGGRKLPEPAILFPAVQGVPEPPAELLLAGRQLWEQIFTSGAAWIAPTDHMAVEQLCRFVDDLEIARERYRATRDAADGRLVNNMVSTLGSQLAALGFDPASRGRMGLAEVKAASKLDELLSKRASRG